jgi:ABC-type antimicrobial peptide transport system permease subunit
METRISDSLLVRRTPAILAGFFSAIALFLTTLGVFGVLSYSVSQRRREIGVRMALGARPQQIQGQFFSLAMRLLAGGLILGVASALVSRKTIQVVLYQVPALPLTVYLATAGVISVVCIFACVWPAHRASKISPMQALSGE